MKPDGYEESVRTGELGRGVGAGLSGGEGKPAGTRGVWRVKWWLSYPSL